MDDAGLGLVSHDARFRVEQDCERGRSSSWPSRAGFSPSGNRSMGITLPAPNMKALAIVNYPTGTHPQTATVSPGAFSAAI